MNSNSASERMAQAYDNERRKPRKTIVFDKEVVSSVYDELIIRIRRGERCSFSSIVNERVRDSFNIL